MIMGSLTLSKHLMQKQLLQLYRLCRVDFAELKNIHKFKEGKQITYFKNPH